jgi:hypothetical protein
VYWEVGSGVGVAELAFNKTRELVTQGLNKELKETNVKTLVSSVALCLSEIWTMKQEIVVKLKAFEIRA